MLVSIKFLFWYRNQSSSYKPDFRLLWCFQSVSITMPLNLFVFLFSSLLSFPLYFQKKIYIYKIYARYLFISFKSFSLADYCKISKPINSMFSSDRKPPLYNSFNGIPLNDGSDQNCPQILLHYRPRITMNLWQRNAFPLQSSRFGI